jgi:tetratricopeptide (TPR) repeat protein
MRLHAAATLVLTTVAALGAAQTPTLIVVQERLPLVDDIDVNVLVLPHVAESLDRDGRVVPVQWSGLDPTFRQWQSDGALGNLTAESDGRAVRGAAARLGAEFVLVIVAKKVGDGMSGQAELFQRGRRVWKADPGLRPDDPPGQPGRVRVQNAEGAWAIFVGNAPDWGQTGRGFADTLVQQMVQGPLNRLKPRPRIDEQGGGTLGATPIDSANVEDLAAEADRLVAAGRVAQAVLIVRDAIDRNPFSADLRGLAVRVLLAWGRAREAAHEARQAASLAPDRGSFWLLAADASLAAGDLDAAADAIQEARARGVDLSQAQEVEGLVLLARGSHGRAAELLHGAATTRARTGRATALAFLGQSDELAKTLAGLTEPDPASYAIAIAAVERGLAAWVERLRDVLPKARLNPRDPAVVTEAGQVAEVAKALATLVERLPFPAGHKQSAEGRSLAHVLLAQAAHEAFDFARTGDEDRGEEATISLGEALKLLPVVERQYAIERGAG